MAATLLAPSHHGFFRHLLFSLLALRCGLAVEMKQEPPFARKRQNEDLELTCDVDQENYYFYWYRQLPGQIELQPLGYFNTFEDDLKPPDGKEKDPRLSGRRNGKNTTLALKNLAPNDTGLYLCATKDTVILAGTGGGPECNKKEQSPNALLMGPTCHKDNIILVCLAQGFFYEWPIDVTWTRDDKEVPRLAFATQQPLSQGTCSFSVTSRLRITASEWREGHKYSCSVMQGNSSQATASVMSERIVQSKSLGAFKFQLSLRAGQLIFLLLAAKSLAYGTILGIYTGCKKTGF